MTLIVTMITILLAVVLFMTFLYIHDLVHRAIIDRFYMLLLAVGWAGLFAVSCIMYGVMQNSP